MVAVVLTVSHCGEAPIRQAQSEREESWLMPAFEITDGPTEKRIRDSFEYADDPLAEILVQFEIRQGRSSGGVITCKVIGVERMNMNPGELLLKIAVPSNPMFGTPSVYYNANTQKGDRIKR